MREMIFALARDLQGAELLPEQSQKKKCVKRGRSARSPLPLPQPLFTMHRPLRSCFRDALFILLGAASMQLCSSFLPHLHEFSPITFNNIRVPHPAPAVLDSWHSPQPCNPPSPIPNLGHEIPRTELVSHAPGWTIFRNLYMADGTLFIVTSNPESIPSIDLMTSTGLPGLNTPESIAERMPTARDMAVITPQEAHQRWGGQSINNVYPVEGSTVRNNTPLSGSSSLTFEPH
jgi:hypothetical protein